MAAHEIVTIQIGKFSNFIGTHWWNIQESSFCYSPSNSESSYINHDVTFQEGINLRRETTFTPRLVLVDSQENFRSLRKECALYRNEESKTHLWDGSVEVIKEKPCKRNPFLEEPETFVNSDSGEKELSPSIDVSEFEYSSTSWSDFLKTYLHPNSLCLLNEVYSDDHTDPLELYSNGEAVYKKKGEIIEESLRKMTENCDYLQGFQIIYDAYNGFSGIGGQIFQHLDDEYKRRPSICYPVYQDDKELPVQDIKKQMHRLYAILLSLSDMNSYCTSLSPLSMTDDVVNLSYPFQELPHVQYNEKLLYHTSAIFAAAIETLSSPFRLRSPKHSLYDITNSMSTYGRKLICSSICLPFPLDHDAYLSAMIEKEVPEYYMTSLSPYYKPESERTLLQSAVLRGIPVNKYQNPDKLRLHLLKEEIFGEYLNKYSSSSVTTATVFEEKCCVSCPYPKFFKNIVSDEGFLNSTINPHKKGVEKIPVAASFSSSDSASKFLEDLLSKAYKISFKEYTKCVESTYEKDSYHEMIENLIGLQDNYTNY